MKLVKVQPTQYTIVCNKEEVDKIIHMIEFYTTRNPSEDELYVRESTMTSANPCIDTIHSVYLTLCNTVDIRAKDIKDIYEF